MQLGKRVLLAEDDPICADLAAYALEAAGFEVVTVGDGIEAGLRLAAEAFDIAVVDIEMPGADGLSVVRTCRGGGPNTSTPMVVMTGHDDSATTLSAYKQGATSFITKPIDWTQLAGNVEGILKARQASMNSASIMERARYWLRQSKN